MDDVVGEEADDGDAAAGHHDGEHDGGGPAEELRSEHAHQQVDAVDDRRVDEDGPPAVGQHLGEGASGAEVPHQALRACHQIERAADLRKRVRLLTTRTDKLGSRGVLHRSSRS